MKQQLGYPSNKTSIYSVADSLKEGFQLGVPFIYGSILLHSLWPAGVTIYALYSSSFCSILRNEIEISIKKHTCHHVPEAGWLDQCDHQCDYPGLEKPIIAQHLSPVHWVPDKNGHFPITVCTS